MFPLRESADKVVLHTGKYEELIVCSHEIAASTAQLVAASKVMTCLVHQVDCFYELCFGKASFTLTSDHKHKLNVTLKTVSLHSVITFE